MNPIKRAKLAIAQLQAVQLISKREAETFLVRAGAAKEETEDYLNNFEFSLKIY